MEGSIERRLVARYKPGGSCSLCSFSSIITITIVIIIEKSLLNMAEMSDSQSHSGPPARTAVTSETTTAPSDDTITLQVGERRFTTRATTLTEGSEFFARLLSGRWPSHHVQRDGSYHLDADGDVFAHVLRYLRHGTMPVLYDDARGHDYGAYLAVREQAQYFGVEPLQRWVEERRYLWAVRVAREATVLEGWEHVAGSAGAHVKVEHHVSWTMEKVYVCPRDIDVHRGRRDRCGKACRNAQGDDEEEYAEEKVLKVLEVRKTTVFDPKCALSLSNSRMVIRWWRLGFEIPCGARKHQQIKQSSHLTLYICASDNEHRVPFHLSLPLQSYHCTERPFH